MINITFLDGEKQTFNKGITPKEIAKGISNSLLKRSVGALFNDELIELSRPLQSDGTLKLLTQHDKEAFYLLNHSTAHLMAEAIKKMYPNAHFGVGPAISEGFYYDVDFNEKISDEDLVKIEEKMIELSKNQSPITRQEVTYEEALELFREDPYKIELIKDLKGQPLSVYTQGEFSDLCRGGHVEHTGLIKHFKLL
ncbi:MAG: TGS domain-containing protein, partial [Acholeplasmataceae bacterium]